MSSVKASSPDVIAVPFSFQKHALDARIHLLNARIEFGERTLHICRRDAVDKIRRQRGDDILWPHVQGRDLVGREDLIVSIENT